MLRKKLWKPRLIWINSLIISIPINKILIFIPQGKNCANGTAKMILKGKLKVFKINKVMLN